MTEHQLKTHPRFFQAIWDGTKTAELRKNDRSFAVGDTLCLREWRPDVLRYTGRRITAPVSHITAGSEWLAPGVVMLSLDILRVINLPAHRVYRVRPPTGQAKAGYLLARSAIHACLLAEDMGLVPDLRDARVTDKTELLRSEPGWLSLELLIGDARVGLLQRRARPVFAWHLVQEIAL